MQSSRTSDLLRAVQLAESGEWSAAHDLAQQHEGDPNADWIHAVLHKIEGDGGNSRYWYARAGRPADFSKDPASEWAEIRSALERP